MKFATISNRQKDRRTDGIGLLFLGQIINLIKLNKQRYFYGTFMPFYK